MTKMNKYEEVLKRLNNSVYLTDIINSMSLARKWYDSGEIKNRWPTARGTFNHFKNFMKRSNNYSVKEEGRWFVVYKDHKPVTDKGDIHQKPFVVKWQNKESAEKYIKELNKNFDGETIASLYLVR